MGLYERFALKDGVRFNPKTATERHAGFRYAEGLHIDVGDTVMVTDDREAGMFRVRALNPSGMRVKISKTGDVRQVEPSELTFIHRR